jgi:CDP-glucose 4,6-dehydratase
MLPGNNGEFWRGRRVFITGTTGFKGAWLALWLASKGAKLRGYAKEPDIAESLFSAAGVDELCPTVVADIRDVDALSSAVDDFRPQTIFHLAAQSLVRIGYSDPLETFSTNVIGTCNLLETTRKIPGIEAVLVVASDKCYRDQGFDRGYRESDELGGTDPYSASKAAAEIAVDCFRSSFHSELGVGLASARAGNVVGGGDWASDRLVPDIVRAYMRSEETVLRYPNATRPWQHILDCLQGYLLIAEGLHARRRDYARAWNLGPDNARNASVLDVVGLLSAYLPVRFRIDQIANPPEAARLMLDSALAETQLGWRVRLDLPTTIEWTARWYERFLAGVDARKLSLDQINDYERLLRSDAD